MFTWLQHINQNSPKVIVTVIKTQGSTPCNLGDKIVCHKTQAMFGSIGGGNLEFKAIKHAQQLLKLTTNIIELKQFTLGANFDQCCGGVVEVMFESLVTNNNSPAANNHYQTINDLGKQAENFTVVTVITSDTYQPGSKFIYSSNKLAASHNKLKLGNPKLEATIIKDIKQLYLNKDKVSNNLYQINQQTHQICLEIFTTVPAIAVFGAGHICQALMPILAQLPINVFWIDDRHEQLSKYQGTTNNINIICDNFLTAINKLPSQAYCLVITYSHKHDFAICEQILRNNNFSYLGLIGSKTKGNRFRHYLQQQNLPTKTIAKLNCPIGEKRKFIQYPIAIAVSIANQLLNWLEQRNYKLAL